MNKLVLFPIFVMILLVMFNFSINGISPETGPDETNTGHWTNSGPWGIWVNDVTGSQYYCHRADNGLSVNPVIQTDVAFFFDNTDTGKRESFDGLTDFNTNYVGQAAEPIDNWLSVEIVWGLIILALGVGIAASITVIGTGLSEFGQEMIFVSTIYGSLWAFLSLGAADLITSPVMGLFGSLIYLSLTISYVIGLAMDVTGSE